MHTISEEEVERLVENNPEILIIGTGQSGVLKVDSKVRVRLESEVEVIITTTPEAIIRFNRLAGKRVNALLHTTC